MKNVIGGRFFPSSLKGLQSTAGEIDSVVSPDPKLSKIHKLFRDAAYGVNTNVKYIVTGDSTRDSSQNKMQLYYASQLTKIGVSHYDNAESGQTAYDWLNNIDQSTLAQCLANVSGTYGENTIVEFSYGINDYTVNSDRTYLKNTFKACLDALYSAKPQISIVLCIPVTTTITARNTLLGEIYGELATEYSLPLIDTLTLTTGMPNNYTYYVDTTHPNKFISRKIVDYILWNIMPMDVSSVLTIDPIMNGTTPPVATLTATKQSNYWNTADGVAATNSTWRSLQEITVAPNALIKVTHQGNRSDLIFMTSSNVFVSNELPAKISGTMYVVVPATATKLRVNLSSQGTTYDALSDTPTVEYYDPASALYFTPLALREGTKIKNPITRQYGNYTLDDYGKIGLVGESLKIDANGKMKWSV